MPRQIKEILVRNSNSQKSIAGLGGEGPKILRVNVSCEVSPAKFSFRLDAVVYSLSLVSRLVSLAQCLTVLFNNSRRNFRQWKRDNRLPSKFSSVRAPLPRSRLSRNA